MARGASDNGAADGKHKEVIVCGAGIIGSSVAYYLSLKGIAATVIDRAGVATAASGKAGGFLAQDWCDGSPTGPLARRSFGLHEELGAKFGDRTGYRRVNTLALKTTVGVKDKKAKPSSAVKKVVPSWLDGEVVTARVMADGATTAQVHPEKLSKTLLEEAQAAGASLHIAAVEGLLTADDGRVTGVRAGGEEVAADIVVLAMGPWTKQAASWLDGIPSIGAQKAHSVVVRPTAEVTADCLFLDHRTKQGRQTDPEVYPRPDGTVYICGEAEPVALPLDPAEIESKAEATSNLRAVGAAISSSLADAELLRGQACFLPLSPDGTPVIGSVPGTNETLFVASGHSCWGILNGPATGEAVAAMIAGERPPIDMSEFGLSRFSSTRRQRARAYA